MRQIQFMHTNRLRNRGIPKLLTKAKNASKRRESQVTRALSRRLVCVRNEMVKMGCDLVNREKVFVWETPFQRYDTIRYGFENLRQSTSTVSVEGLCGLLPRAVKADQTAERTGQTDDAIVKVDEAESA
jgi:hypothetical protein